MSLKIKPVTNENLDDLGVLFATDKVAENCWCMWFIIPIKQFHAIGREGTHAAFTELASRSQQPVGLLAYRNGDPIGWCATGPKDRYTRALKTPTYRDGDTSEYSDVMGSALLFYPA